MVASFLRFPLVLDLGYEVQLGLGGLGSPPRHFLIKDRLVLLANIGSLAGGAFVTAQLLISFIHLVEEGQDVVIRKSLISRRVVVEVVGGSELRVYLLELLRDGLEQIREPVVFLESLVGTPQLPPVRLFFDPREVNFKEIERGFPVARVTTRLGRRPVVNILICVVFVLVGYLASHRLGKVPQLLRIHINHGVEISGFLLV